ncbi:hypothetical protein LINPERPRIM_LOCUS38750, partial [Linum perenne]
IIYHGILWCSQRYSQNRNRLLRVFAVAKIDATAPIAVAIVFATLLFSTALLPWQMVSQILLATANMLLTTALCRS